MGRLGKRWNCVSGILMVVVDCSVEAMVSLGVGGAIVDMKLYVEW